MSEPSSNVPADIADEDAQTPEEPSQRVEVDVDQDKVEAWNEVKSDYEVEPDGEPVPNSMDEGGTDAAAP